jgi:hypothetical protein
VKDSVWNHHILYLLLVISQHGTDEVEL